MLRLGFSFVFMVLCLLSGIKLSAAGWESIYIDPADPTLIQKTQIPFVPEVLLSTEKLPKISPLHNAVHFFDQKFAFIALSPDQKKLAFSVDDVRHDWCGVYSFDQGQVQELAIAFEGEIFAPYWSGDGRFLAITKKQSKQRRVLEVFDQVEATQCLVDGRVAKNKFLNFFDPWWNAEGDRIFFKVEYNNVYRKSLGLKSKKFGTRIGAATSQCKKIIFYSVADFMERFPEQRSVLGEPIAEASVEPSQDK